MKRILVTGAAGFIGSTLADKLLDRGDAVIAVDNFNARCDPALKRANVALAVERAGYVLYKADVRQHDRMMEILTLERPQTVVHLAGHPGIAASLSEPEEYFSHNVQGTQSILNASRAAGIASFIYASSMSVYGETAGPIAEDHPLPPAGTAYVASKLLGEATARAYAEICALRTTVLRIFSVYGPRQREETAIPKFTRLIDAGLPVPVYGDGSACRSFVYIDDCVDGIIRAIDNPFAFEVINLGAPRSYTLSELIAMLSSCLGKQAIVEYRPAPSALPKASHADLTKARRLLGYTPRIPIEEGLARYVRWYKTENTRRGGGG